MKERVCEVNNISEEVKSISNIVETTKESIVNPIVEIENISAGHCIFGDRSEFDVENIPKCPNQDESEKEVLINKLKEFTPRDFIRLKKNDIKIMLDELGVGLENIENNRNSMIKVLKEYIESL
jgi:hypothetical protein